MQPPPNPLVSVILPVFGAAPHLHVQLDALARQDYEDDPDHVDLTRIALQTARVPFALEVVMDGTEALQYLRHEDPYRQAQSPDLILLDLNLPKLDGREVLRSIKGDPDLCRIPVIVLTTSSDSADIEAAYQDHANSYITKPTDFDEFLHAIETMHEYWLSIVRLPS